MAWTKRTGIMLCQPLDDRNLARNWKLSPFLLVQPKLDGMRAWVDYTSEGHPVLISSQGNVINSVPHINLAISELVAIYGRHINLDGELYSHSLQFEDIISRTKKDHYEKSALDVQFHVFDYKGGQDEPNGERFITLSRLFALWRTQSSADLRDDIQEVPTHIVKLQAELDYWTEEFPRQGYEGIIVRNPVALYVEKRPFTILKWKPSRSDWYEIIGVAPAISEETGKPLPLIGSLECMDRWGNTFKVGTGIGVDTWKKEELWCKRNTLIGKYAKVTYQNLTKTAGVPRFGKFVEISETSGETSF